ncbi:MAG: 1-deoxy-D-xylulose-5-phosphate synthase [Proteobacteria bacterium]|nr:MAG: 1-deoxy-D-xylulose-5-phosphate synthase [Pseudomonadota bacterium]
MFHEIPDQRPDTPLLNRIDSPAQLRLLSANQLDSLACELRAYLLYCVGKSGGHFGAGLGVIEMTIALHYVFNTPVDRIIWDVGHQAYPHKILTGRREQMQHIRHIEGLSGFPKRDESIFDCFGTGHSSTSISAALGMALASEITREKRKAVAVIGDGAITAGMAFEALNHAGDKQADLLVILNDNDMSISNNVGGLSNYCNSTNPGILFEELGFHYTGPIDGHDIHAMIASLQTASESGGPQFVHIITKKGKGFAPAEADPIGYHAINKIEAKSADTITTRTAITRKTPSHPTFSGVFGQWICDMAEQDKRLVGITPAMKEGSDLVAFAQRFPDRYHDVAIAEQHAVTLAAGMACDGVKPVVAMYSTFLQRAYDQLIHDVAIQGLDVLFAIDRAGLVGEDGATHSGTFDLAFLRCIPNLVIMAPSDENETRQMLFTGYHHNGPAAVRYPRGVGYGAEIKQQMKALPTGKGRILREGKSVAMLCFGTVLHEALKAAEKLDATVVDMRFVKPLDGSLILSLQAHHELLLSIEEGSAMGGAGSGVAEFLCQQGVSTPLQILGIPDRFMPHGKQAELRSLCGLDWQSIEKTARENLQRVRTRATRRNDTGAAG